MFWYNNKKGSVGSISVWLNMGFEELTSRHEAEAIVLREQSPLG